MSTATAPAMKITKGKRPTQVTTVAPKSQKVLQIKVDPNKRVQTGLVDQIALIDSLEPVRESLAESVKGLLISNGAKFADGDMAFAQISQTTSNSEVSTQKFFNLLKSKKITEKEFLACISVKKAEAKKVIGDKLLEKISSPLPPSNPALTVKPNPDAAPDPLVRVLERLAPVVSKFEQDLQEAAKKETAAEAAVS